MALPLPDPYDRVFSFGEAVDLSGASPKQLRNYFEFGRRVIDIGEKDSAGWLRFSCVEILQIFVLTGLNSQVGVTPKAAGQIATVIGPILAEVLKDYQSGLNDAGLAWEVLCSFNGKTREAQAFGKATDSNGEQHWCDLELNVSDKIGFKPIEEPAIALRPHINLPLVHIVYDLCAKIIASRKPVLSTEQPAA